jgi:hypothetical protein
MKCEQLKEELINCPHDPKYEMFALVLDVSIAFYAGPGR